MKIIEVYFDNLKIKIKYYIGKNKQDNFNIIDVCNPNDIWFHINNHSSCHVIACIPDNIIDKDINCIVKTGGSLCKQNTNKYKLVKDKIEIMWTYLKNVKKTHIIGCVIAENINIIKC